MRLGPLCQPNLAAASTRPSGRTAASRAASADAGFMIADHLLLTVEGRTGSRGYVESDIPLDATALPHTSHRSPGAAVAEPALGRNTRRDVDHAAVTFEAGSPCRRRR